MVKSSVIFPFLPTFFFNRSIYFELNRAGGSAIVRCIPQAVSSHLLVEYAHQCSFLWKTVLHPFQINDWTRGSLWSHILTFLLKTTLSLTNVFCYLSGIWILLNIQLYLALSSSWILKCKFPKKKQRKISCLGWSSVYFFSLLRYFIILHCFSSCCFGSTVMNF
jgi:hypothetical protein